MLDDPVLDVGDLGPVVAGRAADGGQLGKADAEAHVVDVLLDDEVV